MRRSARFFSAGAEDPARGSRPGWTKYGHTPGGEQAWVGTYADRTSGGRVCIWVIGHPHAFGADVDLEIGDCPAPPPAEV